MSSKKLNFIIATSILLAGVIIGGFLVLQSRESSADVSQKLISFFTGDNSGQNPKNKDSDLDGLTDWQEVEIYRTDPFNPDTDGDGYLYGEEVVSGYDPSKPAPNDKLTDKALEPRPVPGSLNINLTEELAKTMTANIKIADLGKLPADNSASTVFDNAPTDPQTENILNNAIAAAMVKSSQLRLIPVIQDSDIIISNDTSPEAIKNYSSKVSETFAKFALPQENITGPDIQIAFEAIQNNDFSILNKYIDSYRQSYQEIKRIPAPSTWKEIHKQNLSLILGSANIFEALKTANEDPMKGYIVMQQYDQIISGTQKMMQEAVKLLPQ